MRTEHTVRAPLDVTGIPNKAKIKDVNVQIRTQKTGAQAANRDLEIHLATPRGVIRLSTDNGDVSDGYGSGSTSCAGGLVSFDSQAGTSILNAPAGTQTNTTGTFAPEESLNVLRGLKGTKAKVPWTLIVADDDAVGTQSLHCFQLEIKYKKKGKKKK